MNTSEKVVKFKTSAEGLKNALEALKKLEKLNGEVKLPDSYYMDLNRIYAILTNIDKVMAKTSKGEVINDNDLYELKQGLSQANTEIDHIFKKFKDWKFPKTVSAEMDDYLNKLKDLKKELTNRALRKRTYVENGIITKSGEEKIINDRGGIDIEGKHYKTWRTFDNARKKVGPEAQAEFDRVLNEIIEEYKKQDVGLEKLLKAEQALENAYLQTKERLKQHEASKPQESNPLESAYADALNIATDAAKEYTDAASAMEAEEKNNTKASNTYRYTLEKKNKTLASTVARTYALATAMKFLKQTVRTAIRTVTEMDNALTNMSVVTTMSREDTWKLVGEFQNLAKTTGKTTTEIANMATKFYQQGKSTKEVLALTEAAAKAATIAGIDGSQSIDLLTNAMNGFQLAATQAMEVSDKFAALAAASATDYEELATALSKVAAQANLAGMSMDFTLGLLAKGIEVTREAPETIGTALKTVLSRMRELTDYGKTLEDGMDVNRVAVALSNIGIEMMDANNQFRDMEEVLTEVGQKWGTLNKNQQANVAVALAGTRQQSRLIAMMQDFDRTLELVNVSATSYGATLAQQAKYMEGMEAKTTLLKNSFEELLLDYANSDTIIWGLERVTDLLDFLDEHIWMVHSAVGFLLALGAKRLLQTQILKQRTFELEKAQRAVNIEQKKAELERLKNSRIEIEQKLYQQELDEFEASRVKQDAAYKKKIDLEQQVRDKKIAQQQERDSLEQMSLKEKAHAQNLRHYAEEYRAQAQLLDPKNKAQLQRKKQLNAAADKMLQDAKQAEAQSNQYITDLNELKIKQEKELTPLLKAQTKAQEDYTNATQERVKAEKKLDTTKDKLYKQAEKQRKLDENELQLKLKQLQIDQQNAIMSLRNIGYTIKETIALIGRIAARISENRAKRKAVKLNTAEAVTSASVTEQKRKEAAARLFNMAAMKAESSAQSQNKVAGLLGPGTQKTRVMTGLNKIKNFKPSGMLKGGLIIAGIAAIAAGLTTSIVKMSKYSKNLNNLTDITGEKLNKIQVELYNINKNQTEVKKLGDEFENLNNKIALSADEAERLETIISSVNDLAGYDVITATNREEQLRQLRAYETSQQFAASNKVDDMKTTWDNAYASTSQEAAKQKNGNIGWTIGGATAGGALIGMAVGGPIGALVGLAIGAIGGGIAAAIEYAAYDLQDVAEEARNNFVKEMQNSESGKQSLYTIGKQEIKGLTEMSEESANVILEAFRWSMDDLWTEDIDTIDEFVDKFTGLGFNPEFLKSFDQILTETDSIVTKWNYWNNTLGTKKYYLQGMIPELEIIGKLSEDAAKRFDELNGSSKDINRWWDSISNYMLKAGKEKDDIYQTINSSLYDIDSKTGALVGAETMEEVNRSMAQALITQLKHIAITEEAVFAEYGGTLNAAQEKLEQAEKNVKQLQTEANKEEEGTEKWEEAQKKVNEAAIEYNNINESINFWLNKDLELYKAQVQIINDAFPVQTVQEFTDSLTALESRWQRIAKATDLASLEVADYMSLLQEYPELLSSFMEGTFKASTIATIMRADVSTMFKNATRDEQDAIDAFNLASAQGLLSDLVDNVTLDILSKNNWTNKTKKEQFSILFNTDDIFNEELNKQYDLIQNILTNYNNALGFASALKNRYGQNGEDWTQFIASAAIANLTDEWTKAEKALEKYNLQLSLYEEGSKNYNTAHENIVDTLKEQVDLSTADIKKIQEELETAFEGINFGENKTIFDFLSFDENGLNLNQANLNDIKGTEAYEAIMAWIGLYAESTDDKIVQSYTKSKEAIQDLHDLMIQDLEKEAETDNEVLEKRKEAYEKYFDEVDALEEEQERRQSKQDIVTQLSALSGGVDGTTKSKIKELQSQLNDLMTEELEAQREAAREQVLEDIDTQIDINNEKLEQNTIALKNVTAAILYGDDYKNEDGSYNWTSIMAAYNKDIPQNKNGGLVDYTGLAWVDGTKTRPEAFLSADDTANIRTMLDAFSIILSSSVGNIDTTSATDNIENNNSVNIENITIKTDHLNNNQDFKTAGSTLAEEFAAVIRERGLNINVRK